MRSAPSPVETEIQIAERARRCDLSHMRHAIEAGGIGLQRGERTADLVGLMRQPFGFMACDRAPAAFVNLQDGGIENAVRQRLQAERGKTRARICRNDASATAA